MNLQKLNLKIYIENPETVQLGKFIPIFHRWIQEQNVESELLIDVADYQHVPSGPGVMLIGQHANYSLDNNRSRLGFLYNQKTALDGNNLDHLKKAFRAALIACQKLEKEGLKFKTNELELIVNDRLLASNNEENFKSLKSEISPFLNSLYGEVSIERHPDPRERLTLEIKGKSSITLQELLGKVS